MKEFYNKVLDEEDISKISGSFFSFIIDKMRIGRTIVIYDPEDCSWDMDAYGILRIGSLIWYPAKKSREGYEYDSPRGYISNININPEYQGRGLGQSLLEFTLNDMEEQRITTASFYTRRNNKRMRHIAEKFGFSIGKEERDFLYYEKSLNQKTSEVCSGHDLI